MSLHWPANTLFESSRAYSAAMERLTALMMLDTGLPSLTKLLHAVVDLDVGFLTGILDCSALVGVLKASPSG